MAHSRLSELRDHFDDREVGSGGRAMDSGYLCMIGMDVMEVVGRDKENSKIYI